jgi:hypothetical protein
MQPDDDRQFCTGRDVIGCKEIGFDGTETGRALKSDLAFRGPLDGSVDPAVGIAPGL